MPPRGFPLPESHTTPLAGVRKRIFPHNETHGLALAGRVGLTFVSCYPAHCFNFKIDTYKVKRMPKAR